LEVEEDRHPFQEALEELHPLMEEEVAYHLELEVDRGVVEEIPFQEALVVFHLVEEVASFLQEVVVLEVQEVLLLVEQVASFLLMVVLEGQEASFLLVVVVLEGQEASFLLGVEVLEVQEASFLLEELVGQVEVVSLIPYQAELVVLVLEGQVELVGLEEVLAYSLEGVAVTCY
jgi:hypothetical protein